MTKAKKKASIASKAEPRKLAEQRALTRVTSACHKPNVWDKLASRYDHLWVQRYSLRPTRRKVLRLLAARYGGRAFHLLDLGCATGQFLAEIRSALPHARLTGVDKSLKMIAHAKARHLHDVALLPLDVDCEALSSQFAPEQFDIVVCCHSFPYYRYKAKVLVEIARVLAPQGIAIFVQAAINNPYDRLIMHLVEATAEKADYLSRQAFRRLTQKHFIVQEEFYIQEKCFMPSICGFMLQKKERRSGS